jgi:hypothetical protein
VKRAAAVAGAILMIAIAILIREQLDEPNGGQRESSDAAESSMTLVCITELAEVCRRIAEDEPDLALRIEDAGTALANFGDPEFDPREDGADAWLTFSPLPTMVDEQRSRAVREPSLDQPGAALARSPFVIAIWNDRRDALTATCAGAEITWRCIGEVAGTPWVGTNGEESWGPVKPSHAQPIETADGLLAMAGAVNSWFGGPGYAAQDLRQSDFRAWFGRLERAILQFPTPPRTPLDDMLSFGPASFDLTGTTEAAAGPPIARSRDSGRLSIIYPSPVVVAEVVFVGVRGADAGGRVNNLFESDATAEAFAAAGWRVDGQPLATGISPDVEVPGSTGLPSAGVLEALRLTWREVR